MLFHLPLFLNVLTGTCCNASSDCSIQPAVTTSSSAEMENASLKAKDVTVAMTAKMEQTRDIVLRTCQENREDAEPVNSAVKQASASARAADAIVMLIVAMEATRTTAVSASKTFLFYQNFVSSRTIHKCCNQKIMFRPQLNFITSQSFLIITHESFLMPFSTTPNFPARNGQSSR